jgi:hypothetical protein
MPAQQDSLLSLPLTGKALTLDATGLGSVTSVAIEERKAE